MDSEINSDLYLINRKILRCFLFALIPRLFHDKLRYGRKKLFGTLYDLMTILMIPFILAWAYFPSVMYNCVKM